MNSLGFVISHKQNEKRRALIPSDLQKICNPEKLYFETGYGDSIGYCDSDYTKYGANIVSREEVFKCDVIVDVKLGDAEYLDLIDDNKILCGWAHAVQKTEFTDIALKKNFTIIAWEEIFENGRNIFYLNSEVAGEAAVLHAFRYSGRMPYESKVAILGNGQTSKGALRILHGLGANVDVYGRRLESLFKEKMYDYDVLINCILWDTTRTDKIIYKEDLKKMKKGTLIIDISCDPYLEIETSHPTSIDDPVYEVDGVIHYAVDSTPAMFPITVSKIISSGIFKYVNQLIKYDYSKYTDNLQKATVILNGKILDEKITKFRTRRGLFCK